MDEQSRKSIQGKAEAKFNKAEDREKVGGDLFEAGWQATLELMLLMMEEQLIKNPGQLKTMQTSGDDEWDFYLDVKVLRTPLRSAFPGLIRQRAC